ncbi:MAG: tetratricopeptide repeat protein [bacterium]|nr:tetratricopeptide repeat protein [bacterium]
MSEDRLFCNGIDGATGGYLLPPMPPRQISALARRQPEDATQAAELALWVEHLTRDHLGPGEGIDPRDLSQTGWGVVFARDADPAVREALGELLDHRWQQATRHREHCYRELAYQPGESKWDFLNRHEAGFGPADPENVPYYLLLIGDPETIPYSFQYLLDVEYAVGRLWFETPEEYAAYAGAVVEAENGAGSAPRTTFLGVRNPDDPTTQQSADFLVEPLAETVSRRHPSWQVGLLLAEEARKARLEHLLGGDETPTLLFSASHGLWFPNSDPRQLSHQGAILCQDWPGPEAWGKRRIPEDHYFAGDDVSSDARLRGLVVFHFGCYGAGTTKLDAFAHRRGGAPEPMAPHDFVARLPQRLLGHPRGGALAMVAHVERCWGYSYLGLEGGERLRTFESTLDRLLNGHPVGSAMEYFNRRYAEVSTELSAELKSIRCHGKIVDDRRLTRLWTAEHDARSYVVLGDPAVRLPVAGSDPLEAAHGEEEKPIARIAPRPARVSPSATLPGEYADLEIRILGRREEGYPVEITLGGEQQFPRGHLDPRVLPWVPAASPTADGDRLFERLLADERLKTAWAQARGQSRLRRLRLRIDDSAPELHALPWEAARDASRAAPETLAADARTPFSRYLAGEWRPGRPVRVLPIRLLAAIANPENLSEFGLARLDLEAERRTLEGVADVDATQLERTFLEPPVTLAALEAELRKGHHILHFVGHGRFNPRPDRSLLYLEDDHRRVAPVDEAELAEMLARQGESLRLVYLSSCQSARRSPADAFRGIAPALVAAGVPAVLAMQDLVAIDTARGFTATFYRRLLTHGLVDLAANEARSAVTSARLPGAAIPVLFMRLRSGRLFGRPAIEPAERSGSSGDVVEPAAERAAPGTRRRSRRWKIAAAVGAVLLLAFGLALFWRSRPTEITMRRSVAVLGFKNLAARDDAAWLSTAFSEMLTMELAAGEKLRLIPGENVARMKLELAPPDADTLARDTLAQIRSHLDADLVVLGSYLAAGERSGGRLRIDLRLQDTAAGEMVAALTAVGTEAELIDLVARIGAELRAQLGIAHLSATEAQSVRASLPADGEAMRLYAEGLGKLRLFDALAARDLLERAVAADPAAPLIRSALADAWSALGHERQAEAEAKRAFELVTDLTREERLQVEGRYREAAKEWERAIEIYRALREFFPDNLEYGLRLALAETFSGQGAKARTTLARLRELPPPSSADPRIDLAEARIARALSDYRRCREIAAGAAEKGAALGARLLVAQARFQEAGALWRLGELQAAAAAVDEARRAFAEVGDRDGEARTLTLLAILIKNQGRLDEAQAKYEEVLAIYRENGNRYAASVVLNNIANVLLEQGNLGDAKAVFEESLEIARELGDKRGVSVRLSNIGKVLAHRGDLDGALINFEEALRIAREFGDKFGTAVCQRSIAEVLHQQGELAGAGARLEEAEEIARAIGAKRNLADTLNSLGNLLAAQGRLGGAATRYEEALSIRSELGAEVDAAATRLARATLAIEEGRPQEGEAPARRAAERFRSAGRDDDEAWAHAVLARSLLEQGKIEEARKAIARSLGISCQSLRMRLTVNLGAARVRAASGDSAGALASLEGVLAEALDAGVVPIQFEARLALGEIELARGESRAGRARLSALASEAEDLGFGLIARRAGAALDVQLAAGEGE